MTGTLSDPVVDQQCAVLPGVTIDANVFGLATSGILGAQTGTHDDQPPKIPSLTTNADTKVRKFRARRAGPSGRSDCPQQGVLLAMSIWGAR
jgi:hypothetical protein